jgi:pimeloyl-ACP methyl ester carboxylesterase
MSQGTATLHFTDTGRGPPVVLLHAFPLAAAMWRPQVEALSKGHRVIAPDMPGFGGSPPFAGTPSVEAMADAVADLLDRTLGIPGPVVLGGLSMGGYVALAFARRHAGRLRALILADTKAEPDDETARANRDKLIAFAWANPAAAVIDQMMPRMVSPQTLAGRPEVVAEVRALASAQPPAAIVAALQALRDRPDAGPGLAAITVPTLVVVGRDDVLTPPAQAEKLAAGIKGAQRIVLDGAGHLANLEQPAAFNAAVQAFLGSLR